MKHLYISYLLYHRSDVELGVLFLMHETFIHQLPFVPQKSNVELGVLSNVELGVLFLVLNTFIHQLPFVPQV